jgi:hypothetical protein
VDSLYVIVSKETPQGCHPGEKIMDSLRLDRHRETISPRGWRGG